MYSSQQFRKGETEREREKEREREREREGEKVRGGMGGGGERERDRGGGEKNIYTKRLSKQTTSGCTCVKFSLRRRMLLDPRKHIRDERSRITDR